MTPWRFLKACWSPCLYLKPAEVIPIKKTTPEIAIKSVVTPSKIPLISVAPDSEAVATFVPQDCAWAKNPQKDKQKESKNLLREKAFSFMCKWI